MENKKYYSIPYISNSTINWFQLSPRYCWKRMNKEIVDEEKSYTFLGKQLHLSLLEHDEFEKCYTYLDFKTPTSKQQQGFCEDYVNLTNKGFIEHDDSLVEAYKSNYTGGSDASIQKLSKQLYESNSEYIKYLSIRGDYREVLSKSRQELITTITQAIRNHKKANILMFDDTMTPRCQSFNELPIYWDYPIHIEGQILKCKSLLDRLIVDHDKKRVTVVDLKTTSSLGDLTEDLDTRKYYRQLAFYRFAVKNIPEIPNDYEIEAYIVAVNTMEPFECRVYKLSDVEFQRQVLEINRLMEQISWHWFTNKWNYSRTYYEGDGTENI